MPPACPPARPSVRPSVCLTASLPHCLTASLPVCFAVCLLCRLFALPSVCFALPCRAVDVGVHCMQVGLLAGCLHAKGTSLEQAIATPYSGAMVTLPALPGHTQPLIYLVRHTRNTLLVQSLHGWRALTLLAVYRQQVEEGAAAAARVTGRDASSRVTRWWQAAGLLSGSGLHPPPPPLTLSAGGAARPPTLLLPLSISIIIITVLTDTAAIREVETEEVQEEEITGAALHPNRWQVCTAVTISSR
jgi:hypothetical protein